MLALRNDLIWLGFNPLCQALHFLKSLDASVDTPVVKDESRGNSLQCRHFFLNDLQSTYQKVVILVCTNSLLHTHFITSGFQSETPFWNFWLCPYLHPHLHVLMWAQSHLHAQPRVLMCVCRNTSLMRSSSQS